MSEPSKGTVAKLSIRSVAGGFIVSWDVPSTGPNYAYLQHVGIASQQGLESLANCTTERVCGGLPALLALISETIKVTP